MELPEDMKGFDADAFQLVPPETAGWILLCAVCLAAILEPLFRTVK